MQGFLYLCTPPKLSDMDFNTYLNIIREAYEDFYNSTRKEKVTIAINYSDEQTLRIKAIHKITILMSAIQIKDKLSYTIPLFKLEHGYNHGITSEEEAQREACKEFLKGLMLNISGK